MRLAWLAVLIALPLHAGFGPPIPLPSLSAVASTARSPIALAPLGKGFVAAWWAGTENAAIVAPDGTAHRLSMSNPDQSRNEDYTPALASRGDDALLVFPANFLMAVDVIHADGTIEYRSLPMSGTPALATDGHHYLVAALMRGDVRFMITEEDGAIVTPVMEVAYGKYSSIAVASSGEGYLLAAMNNDRIDTWLISSDGKSVRRGVTISAPQPSALAVVWDGSGYVLAWNESDFVDTTIVDTDGTLRRQPFSIASGPLRAMTGGDGATLFIGPQQFLHLVRGSLYWDALGDLPLRNIGAAAANGGTYLVSEPSLLDGVLTDLGSRMQAVNIDTLPTHESVALVAANEHGLFVAGWIQNGTARVARFTGAGIIDAVSIPTNDSLRIDARDFRIAIITSDAAGVELRMLDPYGGLSPPLTIPSSKGAILNQVVITPDDVAVLYTVNYELMVAFQSGRPAIDLGTNNSAYTGWASWDGSAIAVAWQPFLKPTARVTTIAPDNTTTDHPLPFVVPSNSLIVIASNDSGRSVIACDRNVALFDEAQPSMKSFTARDTVTPSAAWDGHDFLVSGSTFIERFDVDGNLLETIDLPGNIGTRVARGVLTYFDGQTAYARTFN